MDIGRLLVRLTIGGTFFVHGTQKLFGWFGGHGPRGTGGFFGQLGFPRPLALALLAGASEAAGLLLAFGFLTPFACLAVATTMVVAAGAVHVKNGFFVTEGGFEFNLVLWAVAAAIAATGPGAIVKNSPANPAAITSGPSAITVRIRTADTWALRIEPSVHESDWTA